jgi:WD40 repeat protein
VAVHPEGRVFALGETDDTVAVFDAETGLVEAVLRGHEGAITALAYSPDGRLLLSGSFDKTARLWDVESGSPLLTLDGHEKWVSAVAFAPDSTWCVTGSGDRKLRIWDTRTGQLLETLPGHEGRKGYVMDVAVHPDGERIASSAGDKRIRIWRRGSQEPLNTLTGHTQSVSSIAFHPRGDRILSGSLDATARMWDVETGESVFVSRGHDVGIYTVAFHPDGTRFATGSARGVVRVWDALSGEPLLEIEREADSMNQVAFTPAVRFWETGGVTERSARRSEARIARDELVEVVNELFDRHFHLSDVLLRINSHPELTPEQREHAARLARIRGDDVWRLDASTRGVVVQTGFADQDYEVALRRARAACELDPVNAHLQCTLGFAQWRNGLFQEAVSTLQLAGETDKLGRNERSDPDFAPSQEITRRIVLTMALHAAGDQQAAQDELGGARCSPRRARSWGPFPTRRAEPPRGALRRRTAPPRLPRGARRRPRPPRSDGARSHAGTSAC